MPTKEKNKNNHLVLGVIIVLLIFIFSIDGLGTKLLASLTGVSGDNKSPDKPLNVYYESPVINNDRQASGFEKNSTVIPLNNNGKLDALVQIDGKFYSRNELQFLSSRADKPQKFFTSRELPVGNFSLKVVYNKPTANLLYIYKNNGLEKFYVLPDQNSSETDIYLNDSGPWTVEGFWWGEGDIISYNVIQENVQISGNNDRLIFGQYLADNIITLNPIQFSGSSFKSSGVIFYKFLNRVSGNGIGVYGGFSEGRKIIVSDLSSNFSFSGSGLYSENNAVQLFLYQLKNGITANAELKNSQNDFIRKNLVNFQQKSKNGSANVYSGNCLSSYDFDGVIYPASCVYSSYVSLNNNQLQGIYVFNNSSQEILNSLYPDYPFFSFANTLGKDLDFNLFKSANYYVSSKGIKSWINSGSISSKQISLSRFFENFKIDVPPGDTIVFGNTPIFDSSRWYNYANTNVKLISSFGSALPFYLWGGYATEESESAAYFLKSNGKTILTGVTSFGKSIDLSSEKGIPAGNYEFEMKRQVLLAGIQTNVLTNSKFTILGSSAYNKNPIDENPPALTGLHLVSDGFWQNFVDPNSTNKLIFSISPMPGLIGENNSFIEMNDGFSLVKVEFKGESGDWAELPVSDLGNNTYAATINVPDSQTLSGEFYAFRISAVDLAENSFSYMFALPVGNALRDNQAPTTSIASPKSGDFISGISNVIVQAADNVGVSRVELYSDGNLLNIKTAPPYIFEFDTNSFSDKVHVLESKVYDVVGNVNSSKSVDVIIDNIPPTVAITAPKDNSVVAGTIINIWASAEDNNQIKKVEFYRVDSPGDVFLGISNIFPFKVSWDSSSVKDGDYVLYTKATDAAGHTSLSDQIKIKVDNFKPSGAASSPVKKQFFLELGF